MEFHPSNGTHLGLHRNDHLLEPRSPADLDQRARSLDGWLQRLGALRDLTPDQHDESRLWASQIRAELHSIEGLRTWNQDPTAYIDVIGTAFNELVARHFAPPEVRLEAAAARAEQTVRLLAQAQVNIDRPSRIVTETAIEQVEATLELFENDAPSAFAGVGGPALQRRFQAACEQALGSLKDFGRFLQDSVLPRSRPDFAVGPEGMRSLLLYEDMVSTSVSELIARGEQELANTQKRMAEAAARIDPTLSILEVVDLVSRDHPTADVLLPESSGLLEDLRSFVIDHDIVSLPTEVRIKCQETPSFMRFFGFAFCDSPGPFEEVATEAFFYITPPEPSWAPDRRDSYLRFFNRAFLPVISLHETYPGHYVHLPWLRRSPGLISRSFWSTAAVEGWAHYCEEMMLDQGYGGDAPRLRLVQLQAALLRLCRYLVALRLHTHDMTYEEGIEFFMREGYSERIVAEREVRRGALSPGFYAYTLGKLEVLKLREEYKRLTGPRFSLREFHDLVVQTPYPLPLIRERLQRTLGADAPLR
ncbi:MAG: DUF885 domain-containing protein [Chloroflexi bacterium]|nr:DUF885 domain-containing protein [Chloroflexota bacterium]